MVVRKGDPRAFCSGDEDVVVSGWWCCSDGGPCVRGEPVKPGACSVGAMDMDPPAEILLLSFLLLPLLPLLVFPLLALSFLAFFSKRWPFLHDLADGEERVVAAVLSPE